MEHRHEWEIYIKEPFVRCAHCPDVLDVALAEAMLNAAEQLSANQAQVVADAIDRLAIAFDGEDGGNATSALRAYAERRK